jgi:tRNA(Ile)-lysidine synthase
MLKEVENFIKTENLFTEREKLLLAISGGIDSVVLLHVLMQLGFRPVLAHCNFSLRGEESDGDEQFVRDLAEKLNLELLVKRFDTKTYAAQKKLSTQMAARELRYNWFTRLSEERGFTKVVLGHHRDDQLETFLINLFRGSGITGLKAMKAGNGLLVRPLLNTSRKTIEAYAAQHQLVWREDSTNRETNYLRNKIRHSLLIEIEAVDPAYLRKMSESILMLQREEALYRQLLKDFFTNQFQNDEDHKLSKKLFLNHPEGLMLLYEYLKQFGYNYEQAEQIFETLKNSPGRLFYSKSHQLLIDRNTLQIRLLEDNDPAEYFLIQELDEVIEKPILLKISKFDFMSMNDIDKDASCAALDFDQLYFPLQIRRWRQGDRFKPLGMRGEKLVSDFFIDQQFSLFEKQDTWLLINGNQEVIWVIGHRIDDRYKITRRTKMVYQLMLQNRLND